MSVYVIMALAFVVAFAFTFASVPIAKIVAGKIGAIDVPRDARRMHKKATPRLGGIAVFFGFLVSLLCFCGITKDLIAVLIGAIIIVVLGIIDDSRGLSAKVKFCVQILAALVVVFGGVNDFGGSNAPLGKMSDREPDTFYGACHSLFLKLLKKWDLKRLFTSKMLSPVLQQKCWQVELIL